MPLPKLPKLPDPEEMFSVIDKAGNAIEAGLNIIDKVADKFDQAAQKFGPPAPTTPATTPATTPETTEEPSPGQDETSNITGGDIQGDGLPPMLPRSPIYLLLSPVRGNKICPGEGGKRPRGDEASPHRPAGTQYHGAH